MQQMLDHKTNLSRLTVEDTHKSTPAGRDSGSGVSNRVV